MHNLKSRGHWFEPHWRHCVAFLSKTLSSLPSTQKHPDMTEKLLKASIQTYNSDKINKNQSVFVLPFIYHICLTVLFPQRFVYTMPRCTLKVRGGKMDASMIVNVLMLMLANTDVQTGE